MLNGNWSTLNLCKTEKFMQMQFRPRRFSWLLKAYLLTIQLKSSGNARKKLVKKRKYFKNCTENQTSCENDIFLLYFKDIQILNILVKTIRLRLSRIFYVHISYLLKNAIYIDNMTRGRCGLHLDFQNGNGALFVNVCVWLERIDMTLFATPAAKSSSSPKVFP